VLALIGWLDWIPRQQVVVCGLRIARLKVEVTPTYQRSAPHFWTCRLVEEGWE
jgi:hypothetical protein